MICECALLYAANAGHPGAPLIFCVPWGKKKKINFSILIYFKLLSIPVIAKSWVSHGLSEIILISWSEKHFLRNISYSMFKTVLLLKISLETIFRILWWIECSKEQHLFEIQIFCNILNIFTVTFDHLKEAFTQKWKLSLITHPHVVPNP